MNVLRLKKLIAKLWSKVKDPIIFVEIDIENIIIKKDLSLPSNLPTDFKKYIPISEFPSSVRDISFSLTDFTNLMI